MAIKDLINFGIGFSPGSPRFIITLGLGPAITFGVGGPYCVAATGHYQPGGTMGTYQPGGTTGVYQPGGTATGRYQPGGTTGVYQPGATASETCN